MKKMKILIVAAAVTFGLPVFSGCGENAQNPGEPPAEVINGESIRTESNSSQDEILTDAISVRIGRDGVEEWSVDMYNNNAALTMLDYLSGSALLFPAYTYDEEGGFVAQNVRGNYTRDDEQTIADVKAGELYLFSGGQLRFYFKDMEGADITATPVGYYTNTEGLAEAVTEAYTSNLDDTWGVDVYFWITKTLA